MTKLTQIDSKQKKHDNTTSRFILHTVLRLQFSLYIARRDLYYRAKKEKQRERERVIKREKNKALSKSN